MQRSVEYSGFLTGGWCWMVSQLPGAKTWLVYLSIVVAILNIVWLTKKIVGAAARGTDG